MSLHVGVYPVASMISSTTCRYEGDFEGGYVHGMGQFTGKDGKVYRGEWSAGRRHGYGECVAMGLFLNSAICHESI